MLMHFANMCPAHPLPDASGFCIPLPIPEPAYSVATVVSGAGEPLGQADKQMETPELLFDHLVKKKVSNCLWRHPPWESSCSEPPSHFYCIANSCSNRISLGVIISNSNGHKSPGAQDRPAALTLILINK